MRVVRLTEPSDLERLYRFRHEIYVDDLGWLPAHPQGLIRDDYDDLSYNYAALHDDGSVVGSMRVVPDSSAGLPLERCAPLNGYRADKRLVELCRLVVHPNFKGSRVAMLLMKAGYQRAVRHGATHVVLDTYVGDGEACDMYRKFGFVEVSSEYRDHEWCYDRPVMTLATDIQAAQNDLSRSGSLLVRLFTSPDPAIDHG